MLAITALDDEQVLERMTSDEARAQAAIYRTILAYALRGRFSASGMPRECRTLPRDVSAWVAVCERCSWLATRAKAMARGFTKESLMNLYGCKMKNMSNPKNCPKRDVTCRWTRCAMGLPFSCNGGEVIQDQSLTLADELHDAERESGSCTPRSPKTATRCTGLSSTRGPSIAQSLPRSSRGLTRARRLSRCTTPTTWANFACAKSHRTDGKSIGPEVVASGPFNW